MSALLAVSATAAEAARLLATGPRRDFVELARATGGEVVYRATSRQRGLRGKLAGPHLRQAWRLARRARDGDVVFADGEHVGIPLAAFLALRGRRPARFVMLGHLVAKPWKLALLATATRLGVGGTLVVHSVVQAERAKRWLGRGWRIELVPYQVDAQYWQGRARGSGRPLIVAAGSENRDYDTLVAAARGLDADLLIAAGSHWARATAAVSAAAADVTFLTEPLDFAALRRLYGRAALVVVPVRDVANQSGITTLLEAMSMGVPVIVSASEGQRECVAGPLVRSDGTLDFEATRARGPQLLGGVRPAGATGLYVAPGDAAGLRAAIGHVLEDRDAAAVRARNARLSVEQFFTLEGYVARLAGLLGDASAERRDLPLAAAG